MVWKWKSALIQHFFFFFYLKLKKTATESQKPHQQFKAGNNAKQQIQIPKMLLEPSRPEYKNTKHHLYVQTNSSCFIHASLGINNLNVQALQAGNEN